ncbi:FAD-dependent oxidoreductase [Aminipila sp.]|uniref:FAD-dependent oxidoreductase n=1 Tax=Aminipila sp. TaxID=2060095 RepID=UPI0028963FA5|nr:FAD-binding oxidoreductase [Aminipila sp.]
MYNFLQGLTGHIVTPFGPIYNEARQGYNRAVQQYPLIIVYCETKHDVVNAVVWSRKHGVPIRIRSGGHNYEGYSNGDCTLVIDISRLNRLKINECKNRLYAESGVTNRQVYRFVGSRGYPFPGGTCPTVGVSGYVLGGGWGLSCRILGLGCDSLEEIEMVNYKGEIIKANRIFNSDLFWACRGAGGGNFGVIVSMLFKLPPKISKVTLIEIDYLHVNSQEQKRFLYVWQKWLKTADSRVTLISRIYNSVNDGLSMLVRGIFYGEPKEAKKIVADFLRFQKARYNFEYLTFLEAVTIIGSVYPSSEKFQSVSRFVLKDFNSDEISELVELIKNRAKGSVFAGLSMYALGGKVSKVKTNDTAFFYRKASYIIWLETVWEESRYAEDNRKWISCRTPYLESVTTGSYVNFPYKKLPDYLKEYYGGHVKLLKKIKKQYDPFNVFTFPQGIKGKCSYGYPIAVAPYLPELCKEKIMHQTSDVRCRGFRYVSKRNR